MFLAATGVNATSTMDDDALARTPRDVGGRPSRRSARRVPARAPGRVEPRPRGARAVHVDDRGAVRSPFAEQKIEGSRTPVWLYLLAWESPAFDGFVKASHGLCVPLTMDNPGIVPMSDYPAAHALAAQMSAAWIAFARTGDPNHSNLPQWDPYSLDERTTMVFDDPPRVEHDPNAAERLVWA